MSNSEAEGIVDFWPPGYGEDEPKDAHRARALTNNAHHFADSDGQVRVNVSNAALGTTAWVGGADPGRWELMAAFGPWPMRLRQDGTPYPYRVRMGARKANAAGTVTFRLCISSRRTMASEVTTSGTNVAEMTTSTGTISWLTPTTATTVSTLMTLSARHAVDAYENTNTITGVGGTRVSVPTALAVASVWAQTTNSETWAFLDSLYVAEYIGT